MATPFDFTLIGTSTVRIRDGNGSPIRNIQGPVNIEVFRPSAEPGVPVIYIKLREVVIFQCAWTDIVAINGDPPNDTVSGVVEQLDTLFATAAFPPGTSGLAALEFTGDGTDTYSNAALDGATVYFVVMSGQAYTSDFFTHTDGDVVLDSMVFDGECVIIYLPAN